jgi:hypothetical protein
MSTFRGASILLACCAALAACTTLRAPHPFDAQLEGEWYYDCRYFVVEQDLPISMEGHAIYFEGRTRERIDISAGTDCSEAGRILTMRFEGTYRLGGTVQARLADATVDAYRDEEVKQKVTYELTPTFASVAGNDPACAALIGLRHLDGSVPALATCEVTKTFRELEIRSRIDRTVLYVEQCRLFNGDDAAGRDAEGYPTALDTEYWGRKACGHEEPR